MTIVLGIIIIIIIIIIMYDIDLTAYQGGSDRTIAAGLIRDILSLVGRYYHRPRLENYVSINKLLLFR